jgi:hypothetical protein
MTTIVISTQPQYTFGTLTNRMVSGLITAGQQMGRLNDAVIQASSGYTGTPGTEFEIVPAAFGTSAPTAPVNLFGVSQDAANVGLNGTNYQAAVTALNDAWQTFWTTAAPLIQRLDNGQQVSLNPSGSF